MPLVTRQVSTAFRRRIETTLPGIKHLDMNERHWLALEDFCVKSGQRRLTSLMLVRFLASILDMSEATVNESLRKISPRHHHVPISFRGIRKRYSRYAPSDDTPENRFLLSSSESRVPLSPLTRLNVRVVPHILPATPDATHRRVYKTPGKTTRVYPVYSNYSGLLFKTLTPETQTFKQAPASERVKRRALPMPELPQAKPVEFVCTLQKLSEQASRPRRTSQNRVMGGSCKAAFLDVAKDHKEVRIEGNQYHWSHMIAHFLGGASTVDNITPGTAASNYETLNKIELFIANKLVKGHASSVHVTVKPLYQDDSLLADELLYTLQWKEKNVYGQLMNKCETISIRPCSYQRSTRLEDETLDYMRRIDATRSASVDDENDENVPRM